MSGYMGGLPPSYPTPEERSGRTRPIAPAPVTLRGIQDGIAGTTEIIAEMRKLALEAYADERVNQLARRITINCPGHDYFCEAKAVLRWFQATYRYTNLPRHPEGFQRLQTPSYTLFDAPNKTGECASLSTALAAILLSLGHNVSFRSGGSNANAPDEFEHVWVVDTLVGYGVVPLDPSYQDPIGWEHPSAVVKRDWPIT